jgi:phospholipase/carboxylesterase
MDPMVPLAAGSSARQELVRLGYRVQWHQYPMIHEVCPEEIHALGKWMTQTLGGAASQ